MTIRISPKSILVLICFNATLLAHAQQAMSLSSRDVPRDRTNLHHPPSPADGPAERTVAIRYTRDENRRGATQTLVWNVDGKMTGIGFKIADNAGHPYSENQSYELDVDVISNAYSVRKIKERLASFSFLIQPDHVISGNYLYIPFPEALVMKKGTAYGIHLRPASISKINHLYLACSPRNERMTDTQRLGAGSMSVGIGYKNDGHYGREKPGSDFELLFFTTSDQSSQLKAGDVRRAEPSSLRTFPSPAPESSQTKKIWDAVELFKEPTLHDTVETGFTAKDGISPVFYDGLSFQGRPTRVFAWVGIPDAPAGEKVPGIVLVHGGGGTAFRDWVKVWMERGYAAIAMDTTGKVPLAENGLNIKSQKHPYSPDTVPNFAGADAPLESQWIYHGVGAVVRANSLLRSLPGVDAERIGITGISWGGILTELTVSIDQRFKFAAPVYGSGYLGENSFWLETDFQSLPPSTVERWQSRWDPSQYLSHSSVPMLFCNGANDKHFRPDSWQKTYRLPKGPVTLSLQVGMSHSQRAGDAKEVTAFADSILKGTPPLLTITAQGENRGVAWVEYSGQIPLKDIQFIYTNDNGNWTQRKWRQEIADVSGNRGWHSIPTGATAWYFNLIDERGCIISSQHQTTGNQNI